VDSAFEALLLLELHLPDSTKRIGDVEQNAALDVLESYCLAKFRAGSPPVAPGVWGLYLDYASRRDGGAK
jgi:hypothetical protein